MSDMKSLIKTNIEKSYTELKILIDDLNWWVDKTKKKDYKGDFKDDYKKLKLEIESVLKKISVLKSDLIDWEYVKINYNWTETPIIFDKKLKIIKIANEKFRLFNIVIWKDIKSDDIKIKDFLIKKDKPVLSIIIPSLTARKFWLAKNISKHYILEWIIKREKIADIGKWLIMYGEWEINLKMNNLDVKIELKKI